MVGVSSLFLSCMVSTPDTNTPSTSTPTPTCAKGDISCYLENIYIIGPDGKNVPIVIIKSAVAPTSTSTSNPSRTPRFTRINGKTITTTTTTTITFASLTDTLESSPFNWTFDDPTGCTPGLCFSCPPKAKCASMACTRGTVGDGKLVGSVINSVGYKTEPAETTTTDTLDLQVQPVVGQDASGNCTDPIDDTTDPENPVLASTDLVGDPVETTTNIVGADAPGGANTGSGGSSGGKTVPSGGTVSTSCSASGSQSGYSGGTCQSVNSVCGGTTLSACTIYDSKNNCTGAYYIVNGVTFPCASCSSCEAAAQLGANYCVCLIAGN